MLLHAQIKILPGSHRVPGLEGSTNAIATDYAFQGVCRLYMTLRDCTRFLLESLLLEGDLSLSLKSRISALGFCSLRTSSDI